MNCLVRKTNRLNWNISEQIGWNVKRIYKRRNKRQKNPFTSENVYPFSCQRNISKCKMPEQCAIHIDWQTIEFLLISHFTFIHLELEYWRMQTLHSIELKQSNEMMETLYACAHIDLIIIRCEYRFARGVMPESDSMIFFSVLNAITMDNRTCLC